MFIFTFPVFLKPLSEEFGWSRQAVSSAFSVMALSVAVVAPFVGLLVDRLGARFVVGPFAIVAYCAFLRPSRC